MSRAQDDLALGPEGGELAADFCSLGKDGTTVNAVASGPVESDMLANIPKEIVDMQKKSTPVGQRVGTASEIAAEVSWLATAESGWISGQVL